MTQLNFQLKTYTGSQGQSSTQVASVCGIEIGKLYGAIAFFHAQGDIERK